MDPVSALGVARSGPATPMASPRPDAGVRGTDGSDPVEGFEAILLGQLLRDLRKTAAFDGESSYMTGFYTDMFDDFLAQHMAKAGGIGLAGAIRTYLGASGR